MTARRTLPNRRPTETIQFECDGVTYVGIVSYFATGGLAEVFLRAGKEGSAANIAAHDCGVVTSLALQFGVPLSAIRHALQMLPDGSGAGPLGKLLDIVEAAQYGGIR